MCNICLKDPCDCRCPNYSPTSTGIYCCECGEEIIASDRYIQNGNGDYMHFDCVCGICDLLKWLGYEIKTMEGN